jgi:predicted regulator of Ras-like GTPase activity (Roadblock/LC7/MglB family)
MYIVIELQKNAEGVVSNIVTSFDTLAEAESKYYSILASAAISNVPVHSAIIVSEEGFPVKHQCYKHG